MMDFTEPNSTFPQEIPGHKLPPGDNDQDRAGWYEGLPCASRYNAPRRQYGSWGVPVKDEQAKFNHG